MCTMFKDNPGVAGQSAHRRKESARMRVLEKTAWAQGVIKWFYLLLMSGSRETGRLLKRVLPKYVSFVSHFPVPSVAIFCTTLFLRHHQGLLKRLCNLCNLTKFSVFSST
ncbi:hypothetical protein Sjap_013203 [Stephania japonica]|uniref:Uncharacterized protein n=1 Tax=Stephania japonica TaxID=461633 RepID=A0AAP0IZY2_9MAGN